MLISNSGVPTPEMYSTRVASSIFIGLMLLVWGLAVVLAVWGTIADARAAEREQHHWNPDATPASAWNGVMNHWGLISIGLVVAGLIFLALASRFAG